jgi:parallel beta-helix repeat protein
LAAAVPALGLAGTPARAADTILYVAGENPACSDSGPGSQTRPFCTIDRAASVAVAGDTVQVAAGTYEEEVVVDNSGTVGSPIVFTPAPGATVMIGGESHAFTVDDLAWITIQGFDIVGTTRDAIDVEYSSHVTLAGLEVSLSGAPNDSDKAVGISLYQTTDSLVTDNVVHHNSDRGIYLSYSSGNTIRANLSYENARVFEREASGIHVYRSTSNTVVGNIAHDNEDSGINIYTNSHNNLVLNNLSYGNGDHGVDVYRSTGNRVIGNTIYDNVTAGLNAEGGSTGTTFSNNIAVDNGINSPRTHGNIRVDSASDTGSLMNDDLMFLTAPDVMAIWNGVNYFSVAALQSATGQEGRGLQADPRWRNAEAGDFHLLATSPAIDSANSEVNGQSTVDLEGNARVDDPGTPNSGVGPRPYDDRGAFEFVPAPNSPPIALDDVATTTQGTPVGIPVLANDTDPDGDLLSVDAVGSPSHGSAVAKPDGTITYTPTPDYTGPDGFIYTVADGNGGQDTATVSITVMPGSPTNNRPDAVDDEATTSEDVPVTVAVLNNDSDPDGDSVTVAGVTQPSNGTAAANANGTITYTPNPGFNGSDEFIYTASDGNGGTDTATVSITVTPRNYVGNPGFETNTTGWNTSGSGTGVSLARVAGGHSGGWMAQLSNGGTSTVTCTLNDAPNWVGNTATGTYTAKMWVRADSPGASFKLRIREYAGPTLVGTQQTTVALTTAWQEVTLTYVAASPGSSTLDLNGFATSVPPGTCFSADDVSLVRTAGAPPNEPPNAVDDTATTSQDSPVSIPVLDNDTDPDGHTLSVSGVGSPSHGTAAANSNGTITYSPAAGYTGPDSFTYTASDGNGGQDTATVSVTVTAPDTNLVGNPGFETNTTGWNTSGSGAGVTLERVAGGHSGGWTARLTNTGSSTVNCTLNDAPNWVGTTTAGTYTATMWVVGADTAVGSTFKLRIREYSGATLVGSQMTTVTLSGVWQEVTVAYVPAAPGSSNLDLNGYTSAVPGTCFYADDISIVRT